MTYAITACSTADMSPEFFRKRNIPFAKFHVSMNDNVYDDDLGKSIPFDTFYGMIADGATPTTSQPNADEYCRLWEPYLKAGTDVLHLELSSGISGAINSAMIAKGLMEEAYPQRQIEVVDSLAASSGYGLLVELAANHRDAGMPLSDAVMWLKENRLHVHHWFFSTDLTSFLRGGRINNVEHFLGTVLKLCPLMNVDFMGRLIPRQKIRTKRKAIEAAVEKMKEHAQNKTAYDGPCYLSQSACYDDAKALADRIEEEFPALKGRVVINNIGTVIGSHTGPGTVALFFLGDERVD